MPAVLCSVLVARARLTCGSTLWPLKALTNSFTLGKLAQPPALFVIVLFWPAQVAPDSCSRSNRGSVFVSDSGASTVVLGGGDAATAGAYAAHACVWGPSGVASFWAGSVGSAGGAGSVTLGSETASPAAATGTVAHPARIVVVGGSSDKASKAGNDGGRSGGYYSGSGNSMCVCLFCLFCLILVLRCCCCSDGGTPERGRCRDAGGAVDRNRN